MATVKVRIYASLSEKKPPSENPPTLLTKEVVWDLQTQLTAMLLIKDASITIDEELEIQTYNQRGLSIKAHGYMKEMSNEYVSVLKGNGWTLTEKGKEKFPD